MVFSIATCIVKHHGCSLYSRSVFLPAVRQYTSYPRKVKVIAAPAVPLARDIEPKVRESESLPKVISTAHPQGDQNSETPTTSTTANQKQCSEQGVNPSTEVKEKTPLPAHSYAKPVNLECDAVNSTVSSVTAAVDLSNVQLADDSSPRITLLNVVKPADLEWHKQVLNPRLLLNHYMKLSKIRLTGLVVVTTAAGYGMASAPAEPTVLLCTLVGTGLMSAAANTINQFLEVPYDSQMTRTKNRVLIRGLLTPVHAMSFAVCSATLGFSSLYFGANALTAALGATNLVLYTAVYTPLKRCSIANTWVGSVVGAIPPMMGWASCNGCLDASGLLIGAILYSWQFPHFNALSWNLRPDYSKAGYRMMSVVNPALCQRTALRHSVAILMFCSIAPLVGLTTWTFAVDSLPLNLYLVYCAWKFYKEANSQSSRKLFRLSLVHLPALMLLMLIGKNYSSRKKESDLAASVNQGVI